MNETTEDIREDTPAEARAEDEHPRRFYQDLTFQVITGLILGVVVGALAPKVGQHTAFLGDIFIHLIQMVVGLIIFCTVTHASPASGTWARSGGSRSGR